MNSQVLTLHFMPWCRLDQEYRVGPVAFILFSPAHSPLNFELDAIRAVNTILADFIAVDGRPVNQCTLVSLDGRMFLEGPDIRAGFETIYDYIQMACLSSLEGREYLGSEPSLREWVRAVTGRLSKAPRQMSQDPASPPAYQAPRFLRKSRARLPGAHASNRRLRRGRRSRSSSWSGRSPDPDCVCGRSRTE